MANGDVYVGQADDGWFVKIDGPNGLQWSYEHRHDAVEAGRRAARMSGSGLVVDLGGMVPPASERDSQKVA